MRHGHQFNQVCIVCCLKTAICANFLKIVIKILSKQYSSGHLSRGTCYDLFKLEFNLEIYLLKLFPRERQFLTKLRSCNVKVPIETEGGQTLQKKKGYAT